MKYFGFILVFALVGAIVMAAAYDAPPASNVYRYEFPAGTITNASADTITIPSQFLDAWVPVVFFESTQTSGTQNISITFQESSKLIGSAASDWQSIGSAVTTSGSTAKTVFRYASATTPVMSGLRARIIITGTGTQVCTYKGRFVAKRWD